MRVRPAAWNSSDVSLECTFGKDCAEQPGSAKRKHEHPRAPRGPIQTNAFLLTEPTRSEAVLVDAPDDIWPEVEEILKKEGCILREIWLTHGHWDHTQGAAQVKRATGAVVKAHRADQLMIEAPELQEAFIGRGIRVEPVKVDVFIVDREKFEALGQQVEVRHVPGHCPGNVLFYLEKEKVVFVGDALFRGSIGRFDFPGGSFEVLESSIRNKIYTLPGETVVYSGHGPETTVGTEMTGNPYVHI